MKQRSVTYSLPQAIDEIGPTTRQSVSQSNRLALCGVSDGCVERRYLDAKKKRFRKIKDCGIGILIRSSCRLAATQSGGMISIFIRRRLGPGPDHKHTESSGQGERRNRDEWADSGKAAVVKCILIARHHRISPFSNLSEGLWLILGFLFSWKIYFDLTETVLRTTLGESQPFMLMLDRDYGDDFHYCHDFSIFHFAI